MSSDWWTAPSNASGGGGGGGSFHTPQRSLPHQQLSHSHSRRYNHGHGGDELDVEDSKMAESIKFLPSFANSPAGKMTLGSSPQNQFQLPGSGMGMGQGGLVQSPQERSSPSNNTRFNLSQERSTDSPRNSHTRTRTLVHQNSLYASSNTNPATTVDEDGPPTTSLRDRDMEVQQRSLDVASPTELPQPSSLIPTSTTTSLHIFGPPISVLSTLQPYLTQFGPMSSYEPGPEGSNWFIVSYISPLSASYALRRHGDIIQGKYMLGFKVANDQSTNGCTLLPNHRSAAAENRGMTTGAGTPLRPKNAQIIKQKPAEIPSKINSGIGASTDYSWDAEDNSQSTWTGWVSERLFGR